MAAPEAPSSGATPAFLKSLSALSAISKLSSALSSTTLAPHTESAKTQVSSLWRSARPWPEFLNTKKLVPPSSPSDLQERLMDNLTYFSPNYVLVFLVLALLSVLVHPLSFLSVLVLALIYVWAFLQNPNELRISTVTLPKSTKLPIYATVSLISLYLTNAIGIIGSWALFGVILSLLHAGCRVSVREPDFDAPVSNV